MSERTTSIGCLPARAGRSLKLRCVPWTSIKPGPLQAVGGALATAPPARAPPVTFRGRGRTTPPVRARWRRPAGGQGARPWARAAQLEGGSQRVATGLPARCSRSPLSREPHCPRHRLREAQGLCAVGPPQCRATEPNGTMFSPKLREAGYLWGIRPAHRVRTASAARRAARTAHGRACRGAPSTGRPRPSPTHMRRWNPADSCGPGARDVEPYVGAW